MKSEQLKALAVKSGEVLGIILALGLLVWGLADLFIWLGGEQTFSQWVIQEAEKRLTFALCCLAIIVLFAAWLIFHFELPRIIWDHIWK